MKQMLLLETMTIPEMEKITAWSLLHTAEFQTLVGRGQEIFEVNASTCVADMEQRVKNKEMETDKVFLQLYVYGVVLGYAIGRMQDERKVENGRSTELDKQN